MIYLICLCSLLKIIILQYEDATLNINYFGLAENFLGTLGFVPGTSKYYTNALTTEQHGQHRSLL